MVTHEWAQCTATACYLTKLNKTVLCTFSAGHPTETTTPKHAYTGDMWQVETISLSCV